MFYYIIGEVVLKGESFIVLQASSVGYKIYTPAVNIEKLKIGETVKMFIYSYIREDAFDLYGFMSENEKMLFEKLIGVSGVGPKAALSILSVADCNDVALAIVTGNTALIKKAQGVGSRVADRVVLELSKKLSNISIVSETALDTASVPAGKITEAVEALTSLGYSQNEAKNVLAQIDCGMDLELVVKEALKKLMK